MTPTPDDVRAAMVSTLEFEKGSWHWLVKAKDAYVLARFADAVLNPPTDMAAALERRRPYARVAATIRDDIVIADWFLSLITPTAKETP